MKGHDPRHERGYVTTVKKPSTSTQVYCFVHLDLTDCEGQRAEQGERRLVDHAVTKTQVEDERYGTTDVDSTALRVGPNCVVRLHT